MKSAVVLFSGGLDSTTVMYKVKNEGWQIYALSFDYEQNHQHELNCAKKVCDKVGVVMHKSLSLTNFATICTSALTKKGAIPKNREMRAINAQIPPTYVPARNTIFLSFALGWAESLGLMDIFIGVNAVDYSGYPDCRPKFITAFEKLANIATKTGVENEENIKIHAPLLNMTKGEIIKLGVHQGVDYSLTNSCYDPGPEGIPCTECDSCLLRKKGFSEALMSDPLLEKHGIC